MRILALDAWRVRVSAGTWSSLFYAVEPIKTTLKGFHVNRHPGSFYPGPELDIVILDEVQFFRGKPVMLGERRIY